MVDFSDHFKEARKKAKAAKKQSAAGNPPEPEAEEEIPEHIKRRMQAQEQRLAQEKQGLSGEFKDAGWEWWDRLVYGVDTQHSYSKMDAWVFQPKGPKDQRGMKTYTDKQIMRLLMRISATIKEGEKASLYFYGPDGKSIDSQLTMKVQDIQARLSATENNKNMKLGKPSSPLLTRLQSMSIKSDPMTDLEPWRIPVFSKIPNWLDNRRRDRSAKNQAKNDAKLHGKLTV